jgi:Protein of unknown function (DUF3592)
VTIRDLLLVFGFIVVVVAVILHAIRRRQYRSWLRTTGRVLELVASRNDNNGVLTHAPRIEFTTAAGERMIVLIGTFSSPPSAQVGEMVTVLYDPSVPKDAVLDRWFHRHGAEALLFLLGIFLLIFAVLEPVPLNRPTFPTTENI